MIAFTELDQLKTKHDKLADQMTELVRAAGQEGRGLNSDEETKFDQMEADQRSLKQQIDRYARLAQIATERAEQRSRAAAEDGSRDTELPDHRSGDSGADKEFDVNRCFRVWALGESHSSPADVAYAREMGFPTAGELSLRMGRDGSFHTPPRSAREVRSRNPIAQPTEKELRDMGVSVTTAGGFLVPDEMMAEIDIALLAYNGLRRAPIQIRPTATGGPLPMPTTDDTSNEGELVAEHAEANEQDVAIGQVVLNAYKVGSKVVPVSRELLQDSATNVPALLGNLLGTRIGRTEAGLGTTGTGTDQHNGILTAATDSTIVAASPSVVTWPEMIDLIHSVDPSYREESQGVGLMCHDSGLKGLKKMAGSDGHPVWQRALEAGAPDTFDGYPIFVNQKMPAVAASAKAFLFGALGKFVLRDVMEILLLRSEHVAFKKAQIVFMAIKRSDSDLLDAGTHPVKYMTMGA